MRKPALATIVAVFFAAPAFAQQNPTEVHSGHGSQTQSHGRADHGQPGAEAGLSILPKGCRDAIAPEALSDMVQNRGGADTTHAMHEMDKEQMDYMNSMTDMQSAMMATHTIKDPDLAFHCGMIPHHAGAIAMAQLELRHGKDEQSRALAQKIIDAQRREIAEMTAWIEKHAGR